MRRRKNRNKKGEHSISRGERVKRSEKKEGGREKRMVESK